MSCYEFVAGLIYWETLLNLIAKLPTRCQKELLTYESIDVPRSKCVVRTVQTDNGAKLKMSLPPVTGTEFDVQAKLTQAILTSNLVQVCWPLLYYTICIIYIFIVIFEFLWFEISFSFKSFIDFSIICFNS